MELKDIIKNIKKLNIVSLSHEIDSNFPTFNIDEKFEKITLSNYENGYLSHKVNIGTQFSTHIDLPAHFIKNGRMLLDLNCDDMLLPIYVIDISKIIDVIPDYEINIEDIKNFENTHSFIENDSIVCFYSGFSNKILNKEVDISSMMPGWSKEAIEFLINKRNIKAIGHDTFNTDSSSSIDKYKDYIVQRYLLSKDKFQIELMNNLDKIPQSGAYIYISTLNIKDITGFPVKVIALFDKNI